MDELERTWAARVEAVRRGYLEGAQASAVPGEQAARVEQVQRQANAAAGVWVGMDEVGRAWTG